MILIFIRWIILLLILSLYILFFSAFYFQKKQLMPTNVPQKPYWWWYCTASSKHAIQPPYAYGIVTQVVNSDALYYCYTAIEKEVNSFGFKKSFSFQAMTYAQHKKNNELVFRFLNFFKPSQITEIGTGTGITTAYLSAYCSTIPVYKISVDKSLFPTIISPIYCTDIKTWQQYPPSSFLWINTDNTLSTEQLLHLLQKMPDHSCIMVDAIYTNATNSTLWSVLKESPLVNCSMSFYHTGIAIFKTGLQKQHYEVRF